MSDDLSLSPNEKLAALIVEKLLEQKLIPQKRAAEIKHRLAEGTAKAEDWRNWIELALPQAAQESDHE
ncbi:MAG: hypothetical protein HY231_20200 [Acidobacteria bacterium]|nr:hypothetical protein [Acidobacteriota bacterium]